MLARSKAAMLTALANTAASLAGAMIPNAAVMPIFETIASVLPGPTFIIAGAGPPVANIFPPVVAVLPSVPDILPAVSDILHPVAVMFLPLLAPLHQLIVFLRMLGLEPLQPLLQVGLALLHDFLEPLWIVLLEIVEPAQLLLFDLVLEPTVGLGVGVLQMREPLPKLGLALLDGLAKRFRILLFQLPQPLKLLGRLRMILQPVPSVFAPIADIFPSVPNVFSPVRDILPPVEAILQSVARAPVMAGIPPILPPVVHIFVAVAKVLPAIAHIFGTVADVLPVILPWLRAILSLCHRRHRPHHHRDYDLEQPISHLIVLPVASSEY